MNLDCFIVICNIGSFSWYKENIFRGINSGKDVSSRKVEERSIIGKYKLIVVGRCIEMGVMWGGIWRWVWWNG